MIEKENEGALRKMIFFLKELIYKLKLWLFGRRKGVYYVGNSGVLPAPLTREEEAEIVARLPYDEGARQLLIEHNLRLVVYIAKRFENTGAGTEDLVSIGSIGLIKAINTFRPDKNIKLATYASRCIENEILMYLRRIVKIKGEVSLDEPLNVDYEGNELLLSDVLGTDNDVVYKDIETSVEKEILKEAIAKLSPREMQIMSLRFGLDGQEEKTQKEVADMLGISQSYISRLEKKIVSRLRKEFMKLA